MQLQQNIPTLGGLGEPPPRSRREQLAADGERSRREIGSVLARARRRALGLALARAVALLVSGLSLALLAGALVASVDGALFARIAAGALAFLALCGVVWFSLRSPLQRAAVRARDPRLLARLIGGPSELLSSVELSREDPRGVSTELLSLLHVRAAESARKLDLSRALPGSSLQGPLAVLLGSALVWAIATSFVPRHVSRGVLRLWAGDSGAPPVELSPIAGDLSITYLYPAYTALPPRTEEGTAGDLRAPRGTEVRIAARADRDLAQAFAVVNGSPVKLDASGAGHRQLAGTFQLTQAGEWSLRFADARGRTIAQGPSRPIEIVADQAPQVSIDAPKQAVLEVDPQGQVQVGWSAADDYGLTQVSLVWQRAGAKEERVVLQTPAAPAKRLRGAYTWEMAPLRLRPGDRVSYHLEAKDNDAVDGAQRGVSPTQAIKVFSAAEHIRESLIRAQALWERLVALLGDRLEEKPPPPDADAAAQWYAQTAQRDRDARALSQELYAAGSELLKDKRAPIHLHGLGSGGASNEPRPRAALARRRRPRRDGAAVQRRAPSRDPRGGERRPLSGGPARSRPPRRHAGAGQGAGRVAARAGATRREAAQGPGRGHQARAAGGSGSPARAHPGPHVAHVGARQGDPGRAPEPGSRRGDAEGTGPARTALRHPEEAAERKDRRGAQAARQALAAAGEAGEGAAAEGRPAAVRPVRARGEGAARGRRSAEGAPGEGARPGEADRTVAPGDAVPGAEALRAKRRQAAGAGAEREGRDGPQGHRADRSTRRRAPRARGHPGHGARARFRPVACTGDERLRRGPRPGGAR